MSGLRFGICSDSQLLSLFSAEIISTPSARNFPISLENLQTTNKIEGSNRVEWYSV